MDRQIERLVFWICYDRLDDLRRLIIGELVALGASPVKFNNLRLYLVGELLRVQEMIAEIEDKGDKA